MAGQILGVISVVVGILFLIYSKKILLGRRATGTLAKFALGNPTDSQVTTNRLYGVVAIILGLICVIML